MPICEASAEMKRASQGFALWPVLTCALYALMSERPSSAA